MTTIDWTRWTSGMLFCEEVENFCGVLSATTEQHVDMRSSRITRDNADVEKLDLWFVEHPPFHEGTELLSISWSRWELHDQLSPRR